MPLDLTVDKYWFRLFAVWCQNITWTNADLLLNGPLWKINQISDIFIQAFQNALCKIQASMLKVPSELQVLFLWICFKINILGLIWKKNADQPWCCWTTCDVQGGLGSGYVTVNQFIQDKLNHLYDCNHVKSRCMILCATITVYSMNILMAGIILCMCPANERRRYIVTSSLIGWAHTQNDPFIV